MRPRNSHFTYSIVDGNGNGTRRFFDIDPNSGVVKTISALDRERNSAFTLMVAAIDSGIPPSTGTTLVSVRIEDVNDNAPILITTRVGVKENTPPGAIVARLGAKDADQDNANFRFRLESSRDLFEIESGTGILRTKTVFDREVQNSYDVKVRISDGGIPQPKSGIYDLTVNIEDVNDNPSSARNLNVVVKTFEGIFPGGKIASVKPRDPDISNAFECDAKKSDGIFSINEDCSINAGRIQNGREYDVEVDSSDGIHDRVKVGVTLSFVPFSRFAVNEAVVVRFKDTG